MSAGMSLSSDVVSILSSVATLPTLPVPANSSKSLICIYSIDAIIFSGILIYIMAHYQPNSFWHNIGQKVHSGIEMAATAKAIWDVGKMAYTGYRTVAPIIQGIISTASLL
jgi:hypothetical protein